MIHLWKSTSVDVVHSVRYLRTYTILSVIMIFFAFSFVGWSWEVCLHLVKDGVFVNRGVMHGPWLPVYGSGVSLIVFVVGGMAVVYVLVPLIDTALSRINTKTLSIVCMVLVVTFAADMVYSHYVPNTGEGITDYQAYKESNG